MSEYTVPEVFDVELRQVGFTSEARKYPRSELGARWIAWYNGANFKTMPKGWYYASNAYMLEYVENLALEAIQS